MPTKTRRPIAKTPSLTREELARQARVRAGRGKYAGMLSTTALREMKEEEISRERLKGDFEPIEALHARLQKRK